MAEVGARVSPDIEQPGQMYSEGYKRAFPKQILQETCKLSILEWCAVKCTFSALGFLFWVHTRNGVVYQLIWLQANVSDRDQVQALGFYSDRILLLWFLFRIGEVGLRFQSTALRSRRCTLCPA